VAFITDMNALQHSNFCSDRLLANDNGLGVSMEVYSLSDFEQKSEAVKRLESEVIQ
jgi:hypothetical protein